MKSTDGQTEIVKIKYIILSYKSGIDFFQVTHPRCVLYDEYMWYRIIKLYIHTQL